MEVQTQPVQLEKQPQKTEISGSEKESEKQPKSHIEGRMAEEIGALIGVGDNPDTIVNLISLGSEIPVTPRPEQQQDAV